MRRVLTVAVAALLAFLGQPIQAETLYNALSVTDTSQTLTLSRVATGLAICNNSTTDRITVRLFSTSETAAAAVAGSHIPIPVAASAAQPSCISVDFGRAHPGSGFLKITYVAASGKTPTGFVISE